ncbi:MAG: hypothetical protein ACJARF_002578, partial [Alteromonadaceae bacterium]
MHFTPSADKLCLLKHYYTDTSWIIGLLLLK